MCEDHRDIELQTGGELSPAGHLVTGEEELSHLGTQHHPHHALLDECSGAADVGAVGHQQLRVSVMLTMVAMVGVTMHMVSGVDVAVLHTGELVTQYHAHHLLSQH